MIKPDPTSMVIGTGFQSLYPGEHPGSRRAIRFRPVGWWLILGLLLAAACGVPAADESSAPATATPAAASAPAVKPTPGHTPSPTVGNTAAPSLTETPAVINPLTGLPISDISLIQRWPLAMKISSYPRTARPQAGLSYADLLFEFYQEAGMTRWHAIFLSQDVEKVGPIRSGRKIDVPLMKAYQSLLVFCAEYSATWDFMEFAGVSDRLLYVGHPECPGLCRDEQQIPINGIYANTVELRKVLPVLKIPESVPDLNGMVFQQEAPAMSGGPGTTVRVRFISDNAIAEWRYDPADGKYYRFSETDKGNGDIAPQTDRLTREQLSVSNVIVVYANYIRRQHREIYELELFGGGKALLFRDGQAESGFWRLPKIDRPLQFFGQDGPFKLKPGVTWIGIVEDTSTEIQDGGTWKIEFGNPGIGE
jgi:hypothetical protein